MITRDDPLFKNTRTYYGKSTDSKPTTGVTNGSIFIEIDTGKAYFFDGSTNTWLEPGA